MNQNNTEQDDILRKLFKELPVEEVSDFFSISLIDKVKKIQRNKKRKMQWLEFLLPACGIMTILLSVSLIFYFTGIQLPEIEFNFQNALLQIIVFLKQNVIFFMIGLIILFLLIADSQFRHYIRHKKELQNN